MSETSNEQNYLCALHALPGSQALVAFHIRLVFDFVFVFCASGELALRRDNSSISSHLCFCEPPIDRERS